MTDSPINPVIGRIETFEKIAGSDIWTIIDQHDIKVDQAPTIVVLNGEPLLRKDWNRIIEHEDHVAFVTIPQGSFLKEILGVIASIALAVFAPWAAGIIAPLLGITSTTGIALIQAGIVIAGSFLISALFQPNQPKDQTASPTYSASAQGNSARLYQTIPKPYGKNIMYCDWASQPYSVFENNNQIMYQLFCRGLGKTQVHEVKIEDTKLWDETNGYNSDFVQLEIAFYDPGEFVSLFPSEVITSTEVAGMDMPNWSTEGKRLTITAVDRKIKSGKSEAFLYAQPGQKITIPAPSLNAGTYTIIEVATDTKWIIVNLPLVDETTSVKVTLAEESQWVGGYVANSADSITNKLQIDWYMPKGLSYTNDEGEMSSNTASVEAQARVVNSAGLPLSDWITIGLHSYTLSTLTPQRITEEYELSDARYEVRVRRTNIEKASNRFISTIQWGALKAFIPNDNQYNDVSLMAVKMLVTGQVSNQASRKFNVIQTAILPTYNSGTGVWTEQPTRSIAWAAYDIVHNDVYGGGRSADSIDIDQLAYLDGVWQTRGDYFDAIYDSQQSCWDALSACLRAGRAMPMQLGGLLTFRRRELQSVPKAIFTPSNIVRGSFSTEHILFTDDTPDDIIVEFLDNRTWKRNEVQCKLPTSTSEKPERISLFGVTERLQAFREGIFLAAFNQKNRVITSFTTEFEGHLLLRTDQIYAAHDLYDWGQWGEVTGYIPANRTVLLDRIVDVTPNSYLMLSTRLQKGWGPVKINPGVNRDEIIIDAADLTLIQGTQGSIANVWAHEDDLIQTKFIICEQTIDYRRMTIVSGSPKEDSIELVCIQDDPSVYEADLQAPPAESYPYTPITDNRTIITSLTMTKQPASPNSAPIIDYVWTPGSPVPVDGYVLEMSYDGFSWTTIYSGSLLTYSAGAFPGLIYGRVKGINGVAGPWKNQSGVFGTATTLPLPVAYVNIEADFDAATLDVFWPKGVRATSYNLEIWVETVQDSGIFNLLKFDEDSSALTISFGSDDIIAAGGPWKNLEARVYSRNSAGDSTATVQQLLNQLPDDVTGLQLLTPYTGGDLKFGWDPVDTATGYYITFTVGASIVETVTLVGRTNVQYSLSAASIIALGGPWNTVTIGVSALINSLKGNETTLVVNQTNLMAWDSGDLINWDSGNQLGW